MRNSAKCRAKNAVIEEKKNTMYEQNAYFKPKLVTCAVKKNLKRFLKADKFWIVMDEWDSVAIQETSIKAIMGQ